MASGLVDSEEGETRSAEPSRFATGPVLAIALTTVALLLVFASRYGYHRDELYFLAASRHLAFGYVDQPPIAVLVAWLDRMAFADTLFGLRLIPAMLDGVVVVLAGAMARELGGSRFAQAFAALAVASGGFLVVGALEGPTIYDAVLWGVTSLLVLRILRTRNDRLWLGVGLAVGIGMEAKQTVPLLLAGLAIGFVMNRQSALFRSPWLWAGAAISLAGWAPNLVWQATHGWPTSVMDANLRSEHSGFGYAVKYPIITLLVFGVFLAPVWMAGWWALWKQPRLRPYRAFAVAFAIGFVLLWAVIPDRFYYLIGLYPVMLASGAIVTEQVVDGARGFFRERPRHQWIWRSRRWAFALVLVSAIAFLPIALPVLPPSAVASANLQKINYNLGEEIGWPEFTRQVAAVWHSIPEPERGNAVIVTSNYGEAGAIIRFGARYGLPTAYSGHNSFWSWGPPQPSLGTTVAVGLDRSELAPYFRSVRRAGRISNRAGVENDEHGAPIWIATGQLRPWPAIWDQFKHYG